VAAGVVLAATADGQLVFLEPREGRRIHTLRLGAATESTPAVEGDQAFVGTDEGELVIVDARRGEESRRVALGGLVRSSPLPARGRVLVGTVEPRRGGGVTAIDAATGKVLWRAPVGPVFSSAALAGTRVLVGSDDGSLHALDLDGGKRLWSRPLGAKVRGTPAVVGETAIVGDFAGHLAAVRLETGEVQWTADLGHALYSSACVASGVCVVGCNEGHVHGVDLESGAVRFVVTTGGPVVGSALGVGGGRFLIGSTDGDLYLLDATGAVLQRTSLARAGIQSSPGAALEQAYVGSAEGLHAVRLKPEGTA